MGQWLMDLTGDLSASDGSSSLAAPQRLHAVQLALDQVPLDTSISDKKEMYMKWARDANLVLERFGIQNSSLQQLRFLRDMNPDEAIQEVTDPLTPGGKRYVPSQKLRDMFGTSRPGLPEPSDWDRIGR